MCMVLNFLHQQVFVPYPKLTPNYLSYRDNTRLHRSIGLQLFHSNDGEDPWDTGVSLQQGHQRDLGESLPRLTMNHRCSMLM